MDQARAPIMLIGATLMAAGAVCAAAAILAPEDAHRPAQIAQYSPPTGSSGSGRAAGPVSPAPPEASSGRATRSTSDTPTGRPLRVYVFDTAGRTIVNANLAPAHLDAHSVLAPPPGVAGWYAEKGWVQPGHLGTSVLVGHVTWNGVPDTFYNLPQVTPGDRIIVRYTSGDQITFIATGSRGESKAAVPKDGSIWSATKAPSLRMITCDPKTPVRGGHFEGNWVVWARPA